MARPFDIPLSNHRRMFGAFLAAHAIPDAIDLMFTGVGCKPKAQRQITAHDRAREAGNKMVWSDVGEVELISGSVERLRSMAVETSRRRGGVGLVIITTSAAMEMTGADVGAVLPAIRREVGCPVVYLPTPGWEGDLYAGYAEAVKAVMALAPWRVSRGDPRTVCITGYLMDRYEPDHTANLREIDRLLAAIGATRGATFFAGAPMGALMEAPAAGAHLVLPYAHGAARWVSRTTRRPAAAVDLPVGTEASRRFVVRTARLAGVSERATRGFLQAECAETEATMEQARRRLAGIRAAIVADTPLAAGLFSLVRGFGAAVVLVGLLDRTLGGKEAFDGAVGRDGIDTAGCRVLADPSVQELDDACRILRSSTKGRGSRPFDLLIAPDLWLPPAATEGVTRVELGFPSNRWHPSGPEPFMGFAGARSLVRRVLGALDGGSG